MTDTTTLDTQLDAYSRRAARRGTRRPNTAEVLGYTAAAGGLAFAGGDAMGAIVHKTDKLTVSFNAATGTTVAGAAWDIDGGGAADANLAAGSVGGTFGRVGYFFGPGGYYDGNLGGAGLAKVFNAGESISGDVRSAIVFAASGGTAGTAGGFLNTAAYFGFRFFLDGGTDLVLGWAKLRLDTASDPTRVVLSVCEWAYEDTGGAIEAGDRGTGAAVSCPSAIPADAPAPATPLLTLLGLGAMGVQAYRRRREDALKRLADEQDAAAA
jgi:hypothetical protein